MNLECLILVHILIKSKHLGVEAAGDSNKESLAEILEVCLEV